MAHQQQNNLPAVATGPETQHTAYSNPPVTEKKWQCCPRTKKKGDRSFLEGCLFALCCCWLCDMCCDVSVVVG